ncbi:hypothetical protein Pfo_024586 [Paulownia fortunei]|nr:hypothetical protein Pfo_024586 [Paulownia fortunei]
MRKISGHVVSRKPVSLSRAAKLMSRFAAVDNGSSPTVSMYLQRAADAFNHLVEFHEKRSKISNLDNGPDQNSVRKLQRDGLEKSPDEDKGKDSENRAEKSDKKINGLDETNPDREEADLKEKKRKKRKSDEADLKEKSSSKKSRVEAVDS